MQRIEDVGKKFESGGSLSLDDAKYLYLSNCVYKDSQLGFLELTSSCTDFTLIPVYVNLTTHWIGPMWHKHVKIAREELEGLAVLCLDLIELDAQNMCP